MTRLDPIPREDLPEREPLFELVEASMGFLPTSLRVMAHWSELFDGFAALSGTILATGPLAPELRHLVSHVASTAAGCEYCQAHTATHAVGAAGSPRRIEAVWEFETSELFSEAERALLCFARDAAIQPSAVRDEGMDALKQHWSDDEILHALAIIALFGYLNRFNGALATTLEAEPMAVAQQHLRSAGWEPGPHAPS